MTNRCRREQLVVVGDALLDRDVDGHVERLSPDAPIPVVDQSDVTVRPVGAALAAAMLARDGQDVTLVTALSDDGPADELAAALAGVGVELVDLGLDGPTPEKVRIRADGRTLLRVDRGPSGPGKVGRAGASARAAIEWAGAVLVADYGRGIAAEPGVRKALSALAEKVPIVWDPHPRGSQPVAGVMLATPNAAEVGHWAPDGRGSGIPALSERAACLADRWGARNLCVTRGSAGALLVRQEGAPFVVPAARVSGGDPCGAGDRFASAAAGALAAGASPEDAVAAAVARASDFVATGGAAGWLAAMPSPGASDGPVPAPGKAIGAPALVDRARAAGRTVVATGGCFDLLHAGHVATLEAARALGDHLVVCLNSDASVRRLKGSGRPLVAEAERAALLLALHCVDAVEIFDEDSPEAVLDRLRPAIWAKGGDYAGVDLPEAPVLERWGGQAVVLPYLADRSTTRLIEEAGIRAAG